MSLLLIDDQGEIWPGDSRKLREAFDSPYSGGEFIEYSVKNLGFVAVNDYGGSAQVRVRPGFTTEKALEGLKVYLRRPRISRVVISRFEKGWQDELTLARNAERRLDELLSAQGPKIIEDHLSRPLPTDVLASRPLLADVFETWPYLAEQYATDTLVRLLRSVLDERIVVIGRSGNQDGLHFQEFGERMFPHYETWRMCAVGAPIDEQPDRSYGRWISGVYTSTLATRAPRLDAVDAIIRCPLRGAVRSRYRRLIFPLPANSTGDLLIGGSIEDNTIDLRVPS